jgi:hypothetical protein
MHHLLSHFNINPTAFKSCPLRIAIAAHKCRDIAAMEGYPSVLKEIVADVYR